MLVYSMRCHKDKDTADVIVVTFTIHSLPYFALLDIDSTHSYVASFVSYKLGILVESTSSGISMVSPLGKSV